MTAGPNVLLIEDDEILGGAMIQRLTLEGFAATWAKTCQQGLGALQTRSFDFVLSDIVLPDGSGESVFISAQPWLGNTPIVFATAFGEVEQAVRLVKAGADDYIIKPYDVDELVATIRASLTGRTATERWKSSEVAAAPSAHRGDDLRRAARSDLPVLLVGETGVGKEVAARELHAQSLRSKAPFVAVNCGAIPAELLESQFFGHEKGAFTGATYAHKGYFEEAADGTLFLDEVGELDLRLQSALLRVLEGGDYRPVGASRSKRFQGRIVAATNADLKGLREGRLFRDDLYYRLAVIEIAIPPLRERRHEIAALAEAFLGEAEHSGAAKAAISDDALSALVGHNWPGNIRELRNRIQRALVFAEGTVLRAEDLFPEMRLQSKSTTALAATRRAAEADAIEKAIAASGGRIGEAARALGISRTTLWSRRQRK